MLLLIAFFIHLFIHKPLYTVQKYLDIFNSYCLFFFKVYEVSERFMYILFIKIDQKFSVIFINSVIFYASTVHKKLDLVRTGMLPITKTEQKKTIRIKQLNYHFTSQINYEGKL